MIDLDNAVVQKISSEDRKGPVESDSSPRLHERGAQKDELAYLASDDNCAILSGVFLTPL